MRHIFLIAIALFSTLQSLSATDSTFIESEAVLRTKSGNINGSIRIPKHVGDLAILIIAGSGPTDRDGNSMMTQNNCLKMLATVLSNNGIASLRYDKRGVGKSKDAISKENILTFENYVDDAVDWVNWLKKERLFKKVIIIGHSEGSLIGMIAAQNVTADGFVSVAGAGRPADVIIADQMQGQPDTIQKVCRHIMDQLLQGKTVDSISPIFNALFRPSVQPYLISWFKYHPQHEISKVKVPTLIIQGDNDIQVSVEDAKALSLAQPKAKLVIIEGMNHILKTSEKEKAKNIETYSNPTLQLTPQFGEELIKFLKREF